MDIVSKKLAALLNVTDTINSEKQEVMENPLSNQPIYSSSLISEADIASFKSMEENLGLEDFSKIILMKVAQKSMNDHDELMELVSRVSDNQSARLSEVASIALGNSLEAAKTLMNFSLQKDKMEIEKQKLEIKNLTINQLSVGTDQTGFNGTQKEILDQIKNLMSNDSDDDAPILVN